MKRCRPRTSYSVVQRWSDYLRRRTEQVAGGEGELAQLSLQGLRGNCVVCAAPQFRRYRDTETKGKCRKTTCRGRKFRWPQAALRNYQRQSYFSAPSSLLLPQPERRGASGRRTASSAITITSLRSREKSFHINEGRVVSRFGCEPTRLRWRALRCVFGRRKMPVNGFC